ncbi:MAG: HEPN domain-containing protein [Oscillospiraceae bacterium]|nr:HEPN domain-containing protein [Oscillospiraceae bacterium]
MLNKLEYWLELCDDDLRAAKAMFESKNFLWTGFICHLVAEKALKAAIASITNEVPPKTHDLPKLARKTDVYEDMPQTYKNLLNRLTPLQIEARYPEYKEKISALLTKDYCSKILEETEELVCWIKERLGT